MRAVVQRVREASVSVGNQCCGQIGHGLLVLLGVASHDTAQDAEYLCSKIITLRIFEDEEGKMNRSLIDMGGQLLVVSQFTLLADCRKGRRPSFTDAAPLAEAEDLYNHFVETARGQQVHVQTGYFGAMMAVALVNDGPVTLIIDSKAR